MSNCGIEQGCLFSEGLKTKISAVLGVASNELDQYTVEVLVEELCDTALMCADPRTISHPPMISPVHKRVSSRLGPHRLTAFGTRSPLRIVIGASAHFQPGWFATEFPFLNTLEIGDWQQFFSEASIDAMLAEHVWEHLTEEDGLEAARNCYRFLKPGGHLRLAVPDGNHPDADYIEHVRPGGTGIGSDDHKVLYDYKILCDVLAQAGFTVRKLEYFDEHGEFHFQPWDTSDGFVHRSRLYDERNAEKPLSYTSLIVDAIRPELEQEPV